jgi:hypothetical protein
VQESLVTMAVPFDHQEVAELIEKISIPVVLVRGALCGAYKLLYAQSHAQAAGAL